MIRQFCKRSQFQIITLTYGVTTPVQVEGDEVFIMIPNATLGINLQKERGKTLAAFATANGITLPTNTMLAHSPVLMGSSGRVPLDVPADNSGWFSNQAGITANQPERLRSELCGIKETITMTPNGLSATPPGQTMQVIIETVHYVPTDEIGA